MGPVGALELSGLLPPQSQARMAIQTPTPTRTLPGCQQRSWSSWTPRTTHPSLRDSGPEDSALLNCLVSQQRGDPVLWAGVGMCSQELEVTDFRHSSLKVLRFFLLQLPLSQSQEIKRPVVRDGRSPLRRSLLGRREAGI